MLSLKDQTNQQDPSCAFVTGNLGSLAKPEYLFMKGGCRFLNEDSDRKLIVLFQFGHKYQRQFDLPSDKDSGRTESV